MKFLRWLFNLLFMRNTRANELTPEERPCPRRRFGFWKIVFGFGFGLAVVVLFMIVAVTGWDGFQSHTPDWFRWVGIGCRAYVTRIDDGVAYFSKTPKGRELWWQFQQISGSRLSDCGPGTEVARMRDGGFESVGGRVKAVVQKFESPSRANLSALPGIIPVDEVPDEGPRAVYEGVPIPKVDPRPTPRPSIKIASSGKRRVGR